MILRKSFLKIARKRWVNWHQNIQWKVDAVFCRTVNQNSNWLIGSKLIICKTFSKMRPEISHRYVILPENEANNKQCPFQIVQRGKNNDHKFEFFIAVWYSYSQKLMQTAYSYSDAIGELINLSSKKLLQSNILVKILQNVIFLFSK